MTSKQLKQCWHDGCRQPVQRVILTGHGVCKAHDPLLADAIDRAQGLCRPGQRCQTCVATGRP